VHRLWKKAMICGYSRVIASADLSSISWVSFGKPIANIFTLVTPSFKSLIRNDIEIFQGLGSFRVRPRILAT